MILKPLPEQFRIDRAYPDSELVSKINELVEQVNELTEIVRVLKENHPELDPMIEL